MHRLARYLLVWICCTAFAVTAVFFAVGFVVDSTADVPPTVRTSADGIGTAASAVAESPSAVPGPSGGPSSAAPSTAAPGGSPSAGSGPSAAKTRPPTPSGTAASGAPSGDRSGSCPGGPGVYTVKSEGGQVTVRYGASAVCLVSALPAPGFTTQTTQGSAQTLQVTFTSAQHRSQITSTVQPRAQSSVRETDL